MNRKSILILTCILASVLLVTSTANAKIKTDLEGSAYGTFESYNGLPSSAEIVTGVWNLKITDGTVWYYACVMEKNLELSEGSPVDSIDILEYTLIGKPMGLKIEYDDDLEADVLKVFAQIQVKKSWIQMDGTYTSRTWKTWEEVTIQDNGVIYVVNNPYSDTWWKIGTVIFEDFL